MFKHISDCRTSLFVRQLEPISINPVVFKILSVLQLFQVLLIKEVAPCGRPVRGPRSFKSTRHIHRFNHIQRKLFLDSRSSLDAVSDRREIRRRFKLFSFNIGIRVLVDLLLPFGASFVKLVTQHTMFSNYFCNGQLIAEIVTNIHAILDQQIMLPDTVPRRNVLSLQFLQRNACSLPLPFQSWYI